eukprot:jgi/Mesvir1/15992/Mv08298-RA.1
MAVSPTNVAETFGPNLPAKLETMKRPATSVFLSHFPGRKFGHLRENCAPHVCCNTKMRLATLATCNLNQWAMDFDGNLRRILESIQIAKSKGAVYRVGPELEIPGYGCEDHFHEKDTCEHRQVLLHRVIPDNVRFWMAILCYIIFERFCTPYMISWMRACLEPATLSTSAVPTQSTVECLAEILRGDASVGIVVDVGAPLEHKGCRYNCRVLLLDRRVLLVRPKMWMANDGNYRELRWFSTWKHRNQVEDFLLPPLLQDVTGQRTVPFGDASLRFLDTQLGCESCEELFTPQSPHIPLSLAGVEILSNASGSHHQLRKLEQRMQLICGAGAKCGGVYLYANQKGCDGGRLYFDGCASIVVNGTVVAQGSQFSLTEVEVVTAVVDLDVVSSFRNHMSSFREQASQQDRITFVDVDFRLTRPLDLRAPPAVTVPTAPVKVRYHTPSEEIAMGPACWLWDYLRRSGASGYLLPLSGGADSSSTAAIVGNMCQLAVQAMREGDEKVKADVQRIAGYGGDAVPENAEELAGRIFSTIYMGTVNSSDATRTRAKVLASQIGASHLSVAIDSLVSAMTSFFALVTGKSPRFKLDGGTEAENLALQNIQARLRMVVAFLMAQLLPWTRGRPGFLLVLGSANVDEGLRGYLTKYDCSSADINPIGGISKADLKDFLRWGADALGYPELRNVVEAPPTAELEPITPDYVQSDEQDMGMTYDELSVYGRLRKIGRCGPVSMFRHLACMWRDRYSLAEISDKVKRFFRFYSMNRHKMTTLTPSYHAENYSPEDNRFDLRQFLYNTKWVWQFRAIDAMVSGAASSSPPPSSGASDSQAQQATG